MKHLKTDTPVSKDAMLVNIKPQHFYIYELK